MTEDELSSLVSKIKYGSYYERIVALGNLADSDADINQVSSILSSIFTSDQEDGNVRAWAAIAIARLGAPIEPVSSFLLKVLEYSAQNPDEMSRVGILEREMAHALSEFFMDENVTRRLITVVQNAGVGGFTDVLSRDRLEDVIDNCLLAIGVLGHESGREFLEYWKNKGNVTAAVALEYYGHSWETIADALAAKKKE